MAKDGGKQERAGKVDDDVDALFRLPLADFTAARNTLAKRLKQEGRANDANFVKTLAKPSVAAWAVNQLHWKHYEVFEQLVATGKRFHQEQASRSTGKVTGMRESLEARREALSDLSDLAAELLRDAGHNPTPDTMLRITTTLEAMSAYALLPDGPTPGRLSQELDPPSFESLASLMSGAGKISPAQAPRRPPPSLRSVTTTSKPQQKATATADLRLLERTRQAKMAAAKVSLQDAKKALNEARARAQTLEAAKKKADAEAKEADREKREAEQQLRKATADLEAATGRAKRVKTELEEAAKALEDRKRNVEKATADLESLLRESPGK